MQNCRASPSKDTNLQYATSERGFPGVVCGHWEVQSCSTVKQVAPRGLTGSGWVSGTVTRGCRCNERNQLGLVGHTTLSLSLSISSSCVVPRGRDRTRAWYSRSKPLLKLCAVGVLGETKQATGIVSVLSMLCSHHQLYHVLLCLQPKLLKNDIRIFIAWMHRKSK